MDAGRSGDLVLTKPSPCGKLSCQDRIYALILVMTLVAFGTGLIVLISLYRTAFEAARHHLVQTATIQARMIEAVARYDSRHIRDHSHSRDDLDFHPDAFEITLSQIREAHRKFVGFGRTGEFTLARRRGDRIVFLLNHRNNWFCVRDIPTSLPFSGPLAEPMRRALSGQSGSMVGLDYRDTMVLAAYEPVAEMDLGIVTKVDLREIRSPFIRAGWLAAGGAALLVLIGIIVFRRVGNPLIRNLEEKENRLRLTLDAVSDGAWDWNVVTGEVHFRDRWLASLVYRW